ncbi:hypothetical protein LBMAG20_18710 [Methylocystaceae bacterium]|nr:hypothetical protein LBMAG20_18710 [Methylocystaceae bacterium]
MKQFLKAILTTTAFALTLGLGVASLGSTAAHAAYDPAEQAAKTQTVQSYDPCIDYPEYCSDRHNS